MTDYALYVESGPKRRKTQVHVLDLLGCTVNGPTTDAALAATPEAIRTFLRFLQRHGEAADPDAPFTTTVALHVMEGQWLGNGNPDGGFPPDFQPLTSEEHQMYLPRLAWFGAELLDAVHGLSREQMLVKPTSGGRPVYHILVHIADAEYAYFQSPVSRPEGLSVTLKAVQQGPESIPSALPLFWQLAHKRLEAITEAERSQFVQHGVRTWTARRAMRRMLEHAWEHLQEIRVRLAR